MLRTLLLATLCFGVTLANAAGSKSAAGARTTARSLSAADTAKPAPKSHDTVITLTSQPSGDTAANPAAEAPAVTEPAVVESNPAGARDTILVLTPRPDDDDDDDIDQDRDEDRDMDRDDGKRLHGGAGGLTAEMFKLDCSPFQKIAATEPDFKGKRFNLANESFTTFGIMGYGGPINGVRMGVTLNGGYKALYSDAYQTVTTDTAVIRANGGDSLIDSLAVMHVVIAYGGLLAEKQFEIDRVALYLGGMLGGGLVVVNKQFIPDYTSSAFTKHEERQTDSSDGWTSRTTVAPVWAFDVHGGISYSVARWLHIGIEGKLMWLYSSSGFGYGTGSFRTMNPGGRIRLMFGNAG